MYIDRALTANTTTELRGVPLKVGQTLAAIVLQANQATGKAVLSLAGGQLTVQTQQPLIPGGALKLTVRELGPPLVLGLMPDVATPNQGPSGGGRSPVQNLLSQLLQQLTVSNASSQTASGSNNPAQTAQATPSPARAAASSTQPANPPATFVASSPQTATAQLPASLRAALPNLSLLLAGDATSSSAHSPAHFLAQLVSHLSVPNAVRLPNSEQLPTDVKTQLKLAAAALKTQIKTEQPPARMTEPSRATPPAQATLQASLDQWLNRLDISQLRTAIQQMQGQPTWVVDMPVLIQDQPQRFQLAIHEEREPNAGSETPSTWQLDFAVELPNLGAVHGSVRLQALDLTVRLYADEPSAQAHLAGSLAELAAHLRAAALNPTELSVYPGPPPNAVHNRLNPEPVLDGSSTFRLQV
ncbi:MAG: flagellar hook-length control protein FliK [Halothiobacillus sp.]